VGGVPPGNGPMIRIRLPAEVEGKWCQSPSDRGAVQKAGLLWQRRQHSTYSVDGGLRSHISCTDQYLYSASLSTGAMEDGQQTPRGRFRQEGLGVLPAGDFV
jgi:hypothetical protein